MRKILVWLLALLFTGSVATAQDAATQQQIDRLSGQIQDLTESQARFNQRLDAIERSLNDLRDKASTPVVNDYASRAELKQLIADLRQIDQKRKEDSENIARQLQNLAKVAAASPVASTPSHLHLHAAAQPEPSDPIATVPTTVPTRYKVKNGDNLGLIVKHLKAKGVNVSKPEIIAANPKINPNVLIPGSTLVIPEPATK
jgi:nucleoid-associated protein YgaU